jgi:hypothetical protein
MNKIRLALSQTRAAEVKLANEWLRVGQRESVDHEWLYNARHFRTQCLQHVESLVPFAERYGGSLRAPTEREALHQVMGTVRHTVAVLAGRRPEAGLLLLRDERRLFTLGYAASFHWIVLGQVAQVLRDDELLTVVDRNHKDVLTQVKWVKSEVKVSVPQIVCA